MKKLHWLTSPAVDTAVCAALLAGVCVAVFVGRNDIRRYAEMRKM